MKSLNFTGGTTLALLLAGCAPNAGMHGHGADGPYADGHGRDVPIATAVGAPVSCIPISQVSESRVRDDWTIDFRTAGNRWYRNTLPYRCNGLGFEKAFSYTTSLSQLCSVDIIRVVEQGSSGGLRGGCGLGQFQPVTLAKARK